MLLSKHTPKRYDILKTFGITESQIITGVHCPNCIFIPLNYRRKNWICTKCHFSSKDAHLKAINDYFLLIKNTITNSQLRRFLHLPSSRSAAYILSLLNFLYIGNSRNRVYHQQELFPLSTINVSQNKTNTIKNKTRGNMDEKIFRHP